MEEIRYQLINQHTQDIFIWIFLSERGYNYAFYPAYFQTPDVNGSRIELNK